MNKFAFEAACTATYSAVRRWPWISGVFVGGSRTCLKGGAGKLLTDIDLRAIVHSDKLPDGCTRKKSRYGDRIDIQGFTPVEKVQYEGREYIIDWVLIPDDNLSDIERLLSSHWAFASSSALSNATIIYDPWLFLNDLSNSISREFAQSRWIIERLRNNTNLSKNKLLDYAGDHVKINTGISCIWNGPIWCLYGAGTNLLTLDLRSPTYRYHLLSIKKVAEAWGLEDIYKMLLESWGISGLRLEDAHQFARFAISMYQECVTLEEHISITVDAAKVDYYSSALFYLLEHGFWRESIFLALFLMCHCAIEVEKQTILMDVGPCWELIHRLGLGHDANLEELLSRCDKILHMTYNAAIQQLYRSSSYTQRENCIMNSPDIVCRQSDSDSFR